MIYVILTTAPTNGVNGHNMRINGKRTDITFEDLMRVGEKFNIKKREAIIVKSQQIINNFETYAQKNQVVQSLINEVEMHRPKWS
jgi:hypothetical protein